MSDLPPPLPCPFCGATKDQIVVTRDDSPDLRALVSQPAALVVCGACGARGAAVLGSPTTAIEAWNRREWRPQ